MHKFLVGDCFDSFLLEEAAVSSAVTYTIDGRLNQDFYTQEEWADPKIRPYSFIPFRQIRPLCFSMIKGQRTPVAFKFVLHLIPDYIPGVLKGLDTSIALEQIKALVLTVRYDGNSLTLISGTAYTTFIMDKSLDTHWDKTMRQFLTKKEITFLEK